MANSSGHTLVPPDIWGMNNEYVEAEIFSVLLGLLIVSILLGFCCHHKLKWTWLPEASLTMIVGIVAGGALRLYQTYISDENGGAVTASLTGFDGATFFNILLPPVIFASGFNMKRTYFFYNLDKILVFAFLGTAVSCGIVGFSLWGLGAIGASTNLSLAEALTFGALISATDPVSTLAVFESLRVSPKLFYIVFGESVLNDAVAIVLFQAFQSSICAPALPTKECDPTTIMTFVKPMGIFIWIFGGSMLVGIASGLSSALVFKLIDVREARDYEGRAVIELALFGAFAYLPFLLAQASVLMYRYILRESCSQFDSLPLTSLTIPLDPRSGDRDVRHRRYPLCRDAHAPLHVQQPEQSDAGVDGSYRALRRVGECRLCTVTFYANHAHNLTRSP